MGEKYYTGTFELASDPTYPRDTSTRLATLVLVDIHPAAFEVCHPESLGRPPILRHYAEIDTDQGEGLIEAYRITGRSNDVITLSGLHEALQKDVSDIRERYRDAERIEAAEKRQEALEGYANATGHLLEPDEPRF